MSNELLVRAERVCAETRRLIDEWTTGVEQTLKVLNQCAIRHEHTSEVLERALQRLEKAGMISVRERLADAERKPHLRVAPVRKVRGTYKDR